MDQTGFGELKDTTAEHKYRHTIMSNTIITDPEVLKYMRHSLLNIRLIVFKRKGKFSITISLTLGKSILDTGVLIA